MTVPQPAGSTQADHANEPRAQHTLFPSRTARRLAAIGATSLALVMVLAMASRSHAATAVGLGTADSFAVLAGQGVTNTGATVINGDLGTSPNSRHHWLWRCGQWNRERVNTRG